MFSVQLDLEKEKKIRKYILEAWLLRENDTKIIYILFWSFPFCEPVVAVGVVAAGVSRICIFGLIKRKRIEENRRTGKFLLIGKDIRNEY